MHARRRSCPGSPGKGGIRAIDGHVTVPTTAKDYPVATSFTPPGGAAVPFANQHTERRSVPG